MPAGRPQGSKTAPGDPGRCQARTTKGTRCRHPARSGTPHCAYHSRPDLLPEQCETLDDIRRILAHVYLRAARGEVEEKHARACGYVAKCLTDVIAMQATLPPPEVKLTQEQIAAMTPEQVEQTLRDFAPEELLQ